MTTTALQRIKEIEECHKTRLYGTWKDPEEVVSFGSCREDLQILLKAFSVMRKVAIKKHEGEPCDGGNDNEEIHVDKYFESEMSK